MVSLSWKVALGVVKWCFGLPLHAWKMVKKLLVWIKDQVVYLCHTGKEHALGIIVCCGAVFLGYLAGKKVYFGEKGPETTVDPALVGKLKADLQAAAYENERLNQSVIHEQNLVKSLNMRISELTNKLSAEMSKKVAADESSVENVNIKNRPMNIADEFIHFCSNEWLEAKTVLDEANVEGVEEVDKVQLLFKIIMISEAKTGDLFQSLLNEIQGKLYNPNGETVHVTATYHTENEYSPQKEGGPASSDGLPLQVTNVLGDFLRNQADNVKLDKLVKEAVKELDGEISTSHPSSSAALSTIWLTCKEMPKVTEYILASMRLCWKMAIQRPPMKFKAPSEYLGDKYQDLYWKSDDPKIKKPVKVYHVFPMLYHGHSLMAKGQVYLLGT